MYSILMIKLNDSIFFFNDTATTEIYTLSLHDALPIRRRSANAPGSGPGRSSAAPRRSTSTRRSAPRSEEHTSELQSHVNLVCRLLLEKKKKISITTHTQKIKIHKTNI